MAIEKAVARVVTKPWGSGDIRPWTDSNVGPIGEIWFERASARASRADLLLKILFTDQPLSIQVHPDDFYAQSIGMPCGKSEAWYVLAAKPGARIAVGLRHRLTPEKLRASILDGSIANLVSWAPVSANDVFHIPPGTIHAIGAGLVIAEIQQYNDATFRLFDFGRRRELHVEEAIAVAHSQPRPDPVRPTRLSDGRTLLAMDPHFVLERVDLAPNTAWDVQAAHELWIHILDGHVKIGTINAAVRETIFMKEDQSRIAIGAEGARCLFAYTGPTPDKDMLQNETSPESDPRRVTPRTPVKTPPAYVRND